MPLRAPADAAKTVAGVILFFLMVAWAVIKLWFVFT